MSGGVGYQVAAAPGLTGWGLIGDSDWLAKKLTASILRVQRNSVLATFVIGAIPKILAPRMNRL